MDEQHNDQLHRWLADADAVLRRKVSPGAEIGAQIRAAADRRTALRTATLSLVAAFGIACAAWWAATWRVAERPVAVADTLHETLDVPPVMRELAEAAEAVRSFQTAVDALIGGEPVVELQPDAVSPADRAAATMLAIADRKRRDSQSAATIDQELSRVIALYPNTAWADAAQDRIQGDSTP